VTGRGGSREGAGRAKDCATPALARQVTIDDARVEKAKAAGDGELSRGVRRAIDAMPTHVALEKVVRTGQVQIGDVLLIVDGTSVCAATAKDVLVLDGVGEEIVFKTKSNRFFNTEMLVAGESWAKAAYIVRAVAEEEKR